jgi:hypothetical protein
LLYFDNEISKTDDLKFYGHDLDKLFERVLKIGIPIDKITSDVSACYRLRMLPLGMKLEECSRPDVREWLVSIDSQILALNENYHKFHEERRPSFRTRYPSDERNYKPVNLDFLLPCLDKMRDFAFKNCPDAWKIVKGQK